MNETAKERQWMMTVVFPGTFRALFEKKKKIIIIDVNRVKEPLRMEMPGIDPGTSRMLSERSTI